MGNRNAILVAVAVLIGIVAVILANSYFSGVEERQEEVAQEQNLSRIVVATQPLEFGTPLTAENLRLQNFPAGAVPEGAFRSIEDVLRGGRVALRPIVPNEPVLASKVSGSGGRAVLSANLPAGMRAVAIAVNDVRGVAGFVRPGDVVDVFLTREIAGDGASEQDLLTEIVLENIKVLAIDQVAAENQTEPQVGKTAVLEVNQRDAQKLTLAGRIGTLTLALRNVEESDEFGGSSLVTNRDFAGSRLRIGGTRRASGGGDSGVTFTPPAFQTAQVFNQAGTPAASAPVRTGPTMTVYRGVEATEEPVGHLGGR